MEMELYYSFIAAFCCLITLVVLNRTKATEYAETVDKGFCTVLKFFMLFNGADIFWGFAASQYLLKDNIWLLIATYIFHIMCALASFIWFGYMLSYMTFTGTQLKILNVIRYVLICCQVVTIGSNFFTGLLFHVDENHNYVTGPLRPVLFILHFAYYIIIIVIAILQYFRPGTWDRKLSKYAFIFSFVPVVFGLGQLLFYEAPLYSLSFAAAAIVIYSFNVTAQRETFFKRQAAKYSSEACIDIMTDLFNRRAYEDEVAEYSVSMPAKNFIYLSMDLNGLKNVNDDMGHDAGDELLKGAAFCMKLCFGAYGHVFRIGGDEFAGLLYVDKDKFKTLEVDFENTLNDWKGTVTSAPSVSCGSVSVDEFPGASIYDIAKVADKRMYAAKAAYYQRQGIDRRVHDSAYEALYDSYDAILSVDLAYGNYVVLKTDDYIKDRVGARGFLSNLRERLVAEGLMDKENNVKYADEGIVEDIRTHINRHGTKSYTRYYNTLKDGKTFVVMVEVIAAKEYDSDNNMTVYVYLKKLGSELKPLTEDIV